MTYAQVLVKILAEVTGQPESKFSATLDLTREKAAESGSKTKLDEELSPHEAEKLMEQLRKEGPGILAWLVRGAVSSYKNTGHA